MVGLVLTPRSVTARRAGRGAELSGQAPYGAVHPPAVVSPPLDGAFIRGGDRNVRVRVTPD